MNRKKFIRTMSMFGAGLTIAPWKLVGAAPSIQRFRLPPASVHIPHGNFAASNSEKLMIPELDLECNVQLFMRNGITPSNDDLTICSFQRGEERHDIYYTAGGKSFSEGEFKGLKVTLCSSNREFFTVEKV